MGSNAGSENGRVVKAAIGNTTEEITAFCENWQVTRLALFGSVLRDDFGPRK